MKLQATFMAQQGAAKVGEPVYDLVINEETKRPLEIATQCLMKLLQDNKDTEYGKKYHFADIKTVEDYQKMVPIIIYDDVAESLERMMNGEKNILTAYNFNHMNETSGTIGAMKVIPMTDQQTQMFVKYNRRYTDGMMSRKMDPKWMEGRAFCTSEGCHRTLSSGITVGSASSKMVDYIGGRGAADKIFRTMYTSPIDASAPLPGVDSKYLHARFFLEDKDVTGIVCGFFSLATLYLKYIADNYEMLIHDIETGTIDPSIHMVQEVKDAILSSLAPNPERANELKEIFKNGSDFPFLPKVWPSLSYIVGAGADGFSNFDTALNERYGGQGLTRIYSGVTASEGLFSIPLDINNPDSILAAETGFMEFLPVEAGDDFSKIVTMDKLEVGKIYEIIYTNLAGLYRYRMSDAVQCTGYYNKTPLVQFMYRVNKTVNLVAEKTTEKALTLAVFKSMEELGIHLRDYSMYPNGDVFPVRYEFLLETIDGKIPDIPIDTISKSINKCLCEFNAEYEDCFNVDHTIDWPAVYWLEPLTNDHFIDFMAAKGKSPSQQKPVRIISNELQRSFFYKLRVNTESDMCKAKAVESVVDEAVNLAAISDAIFDHPENRYHEEFAMETICNYLSDMGFAIEKGIAGLPTAFTAIYGKGTPRIGILAEYDALDGLSQEAGALEKRAVVPGAKGHGCGHNVLAGGAVGAAVVLKRYLEAYPDRGQVVLFGCPDEEVSGGKVFMAREGVFNDIDMALCWHPGDMNIIPFGTTSALKDILYTFEGESSHAVASFKMLHNALEAAELMNTGTQYLKSQIGDFGHVNYSFADAGGDLPNVVPAETKLHYCVRTYKQKDMNWLVDRVDKIAQGAALMTDTTVKSRVIGACSGYITNDQICRILFNNFEKLGTVSYTDEEIVYAEQLRATTQANSKALKACIAVIEEKDKRKVMLEHLNENIFTGLIPPTSTEINNPGSTDVGDVSRICPTAQLGISIWPVGIVSHSWQAVAMGKSSIAHKGMLRAAQVLGATAIDFMENPTLLENARLFHTERTSGHPYKSPIPEDLKPNIG